MESGYYWLTKACSEPEIVFVQWQTGDKVFYELHGMRGIFHFVPADSAWKLEGPIVYNCD